MPVTSYSGKPNTASDLIKTFLASLFYQSEAGFAPINELEPGGWTIREVVHHVPDSHMNSYVRFKLALTENEPLIRTYDEAAWGRLDDVRSTPVEVSLQFLDALHSRWVSLLRSMTEPQGRRTLVHPEKMDVNNGRIRLDQMLAMYAWHGDHHVAHAHQALGRR